MGIIHFEGIGPYTLPEATGASVQRREDNLMLSFRFWKSESAWTLLRVPLPITAARVLHERLGAVLGAGGAAVKGD